MIIKRYNGGVAVIVRNRLYIISMIKGVLNISRIYQRWIVKIIISSIITEPIMNNPEMDDFVKSPKGI